MLLILHKDFIFRIKGKKRAYVENETLKIDSRFVYWEDIMYALAYKLSGANSCLYCGKILKREKLTLDHLFSRNYGGVSISNNLFPCCDDCNSIKGCLDGNEFWELKKKETEEEANNYRKNVLEEKEKIRYKRGFILPEYWIDYCNISDLKIREYYNKIQTESNKLRENKQYIEEYGYLKRPIIVDKNYWVLDGYNWYLASKQKQISVVPIIRLENVELIKL